MLLVGLFVGLLVGLLVCWLVGLLCAVFEESDINDKNAASSAISCCFFRLCG